MKEKVRVVYYTRVSTKEQALEGYSLQNQEKEIKDYCGDKKWEIIGGFSDEGLSGAELTNRVGLKNATRLALDEKVNYLLVWKVSRLSRRLVDVVNIVDELEKNRIYLATVKENLDTTTPRDKMFLYFAGVFAEMERENIITQVRGGMSQKARQGEWGGGVPPLGYNLVDKKLIINKEEEEIIKLIYTEYLKGSGYLAIVDMLKDKGYKTKTHITQKGKVMEGKHFSGNSVKSILQNPIYQGKLRWGYRTDWGVKEPDGRRKRKYDTDCIYVNGIHEHIISEEDFEKVQDMIKNNPRSHVKRFNGSHLLSGLLRCPLCGYGMSYQPVKKKDETGEVVKLYEYYTCNQYQNKKQCKPNSINKQKIEAEFFVIFDKLTKEDTFVKLLQNSADGTDTHIGEVEENITRKEKELERLEKEKSNLVAMIRRGTERVKDTIEDEIDKILLEMEDVEKDILNDERKIRELKTKSLDRNEIMGTIKNAAQVIPQLEKEAQQRLVRGLIKSITTKDKHISEIGWSFGGYTNVLGLYDASRTLPQVTDWVKRNQQFGEDALRNKMSLDY